VYIKVVAPFAIIVFMLCNLYKSWGITQKAISILVNFEAKGVGFIQRLHVVVQQGEVDRRCPRGEHCPHDPFKHSITIGITYG
jgi:hypothetical protein